MKLFFFAFILMQQISLALANQAVPPLRATDIMTNQQQGNCIACHDLPGISGLSSNFAPSLKGVGAKWTREELVQWVTDARMIKPDTLMPPYGSIEGLVKVNPPRTVLTKEQIRDAVNTMQTWR